MEEKAVKYLETAVHTEIEGYNFYIAASNTVEDKHGKTVFTHLSREELDHIKVLKTISGSLEVKGKWLTYEDAIAFDSGKKGAPIFMKDNELTKRLKQNPTELNAMTIAMEIEENAVGFYSGRLKKAVEPEEKEVLIKILDMEKNHLKLLRWERESIIHTGFWADIMEFSVEKDLE